MKLRQAARRLYTADGSMKLSVDDLISWAQDSYFNEQKKRLKHDAKTSAQQQGRHRF